MIGKMKYNRQWYLDNKVNIQKRYQKYRTLHHDEYLLQCRKRNRTIAGRFGRCKNYSKKRGLEWSITKEQYIDLLKEDKCHYCYGKLPETSYGLDRKDNSKGYQIENVVPCCTTCNTMKGHLITYNEMIMIWKLRKEL